MSGNVPTISTVQSRADAFALPVQQPSRGDNSTFASLNSERVELTGVNYMQTKGYKPTVQSGGSTVYQANPTQKKPSNPFSGMKAALQKVFDRLSNFKLPSFSVTSFRVPDFKLQLFALTSSKKKEWNIGPVEESWHNDGLNEMSHTNEEGKLVERPVRPMELAIGQDNNLDQSFYEFLDIPSRESRSESMDAICVNNDDLPSVRNDDLPSVLNGGNRNTDMRDSAHLPDMRSTTIFVETDKPEFWKSL